ncbi:MAG TPA: hypothetical protein VI636_11160 [Candidatus Angelobacter sp.]
MNSGVTCTIVMAIVTAQPGQEKDKNKKPLTPEAFNKFLLWLDADRDVAGTKYEEIRNKLVRYFVHKGCEDPDELFGITIDRVAVILARDNNYSNPLALCFGVARNVWLEYQKKPIPDQLDEDFEIQAPELDDSDSHEQKLKCLETCLDKLPGADRTLISRYHGAEGRDKIETRKQLAAEQGGNNVLRIRTFRIRAKLHTCVEECLKRRVN